MEEKEMVDTSMQFPRELYDRIKRAAEADERSMAYIIRKATQLYLDALITAQQPAPREKGKAQK